VRIKKGEFMELSRTELSELIADAYSKGVAAGGQRASEYMQKISDAEMMIEGLNREKRELIQKILSIERNEKELWSTIRSNYALKGVITKLKKKINSEKK